MGHNQCKPKPKAGVFTVEYVPGRGHVVVDPDGRWVSAAFSSGPQANVLRDAKQRALDASAKRGPRPCLTCGAQFQSEGVHNRLCTSCRSANSDTQPYQFINPRRRQG